MAKARVNKSDVVRIKQASKMLKEKIQDLSKVAKEIARLVSEIRSKVEEVENQIELLNSSIEKIKNTIRKLDKRIDKIKVEIKKTKAIKDVTPQYIPSFFGLKKNPEYIRLVNLINELESYLDELLDMKMRCEDKLSKQQNLMKNLEEIKEKLDKSAEELENYRPEVINIMNKIESNSQRAEKLLEKIVIAIDKYLNVRIPVINCNVEKDNIIKGVDSGEIVLGKNGSFWAKEMGNYGEMRTSQEFKNNGFMEMTDSPVSLNDKIKHGIDHVFYKDDNYYIVDSKSGPGAHLEPKTATGPQLSDTWIDARLDGAVGKEAADIIREKMIFEPESTYRIVSKVDVGEETIYGLVDQNGKIIKEADKIDELFI